jgi:hypothetical protein
MKKALLCLALLTLPAAARADRTLDVVNAVLSEGGSEVQLSFRDRDTVPQDCDYFVSRFEYVSAAVPALLLVDLTSPDPCLVDRIGRREGSLKWTLPPALRGAGRLTVVANGETLGELRFSDASVSFVPGAK